MEHPCVATSIEGFVCLVVQLITHGYYFYVQGNTRTERELSPSGIDERIVHKFGANLPKWTRIRRRKQGHAAVRYVRYGKDWFLFATHGKHRFFEEHMAKNPGEPHQFKDIREGSIRFHGYSIGLSKRGFHKKTPEERAEYRACKLAQKRSRRAGEHYEYVPRGRRLERWTGSVRIERGRYLALWDEFLGIATHWSVDRIAKRLYCVPFEPFAPVRRQLLTVLREVNRARRHVGYEPVSTEAIRFKRKHVAAFKPAGEIEKSLPGSLLIDDFVNVDHVVCFVDQPSAGDHDDAIAGSKDSVTASPAVNETQ